MINSLFNVTPATTNRWYEDVHPIALNNNESYHKCLSNEQLRVHIDFSPEIN